MNLRYKYIKQKKQDRKAYKHTVRLYSNEFKTRKMLLLRDALIGGKKKIKKSKEMVIPKVKDSGLEQSEEKGKIWRRKG